MVDDLHLLRCSSGLGLRLSDHGADQMAHAMHLRHGKKAHAVGLLPLVLAPTLREAKLCLCGVDCGADSEDRYRVQPGTGLLTWKGHESRGL